MDGYSAYKFYLAIKLHYSKDSYDVFEKRGSVKYSREQFDKRNDKMLFEKLSRKYQKEQELIQFYVSNFAYGNETPVYELLQAESYYTNWLRRKESITQVFTDDLNCIIMDSEKNKLQKELGENKYAVCAPTHKASLLIGAVTVYNLFNIDPHTHTYIKSTVEKVEKRNVRSPAIATLRIVLKGFTPNPNLIIYCLCV